ncbi:MAG: TetR/AcrR family transcriptional regulator C-terminal domain-containing protein [Lachnospiraceae bacterium]|nr:TetR/AcrR family transcriptional regulator C-terminal domain-containing protein [Lachnospiraceae bacterium]
MANFTERAIKESFVKLLNERPIDKITVKDIVEDCGINRNSFYYHFQDVPMLLGQIVRDQAELVITEYPTVDSLEAAMEAIISFALKNKNAVLHIFNSVNRDILERNLSELCEDVIGKYIDSIITDKKYTEDDRRIIVGFLKCEFFGVTVNWLNDGMKEDLMKDSRRFFEMMPGLLEGALKITETIKNE